MADVVRGLLMAGIAVLVVAIFLPHRHQPQDSWWLQLLTALAIVWLGDLVWRRIRRKG